MINPYFNSNWYGNAEQTLTEDLIIESIQIYGTDCEYLPYSLPGYDHIFGEDSVMEYTSSYPIEMYLETVNSWDADDLMTKFGLQAQEKGSLMVSMSRFRHCTNNVYYRPREKDLIYFPITDGLYEILSVSEDKLFWNAGALTTWSIKFDLVNWSHQKLATGDPRIDKFSDRKSYALIFTVSTTAQGAQGAQGFQGTGNYLLGETVYQGTSLASCTAKGTVVYYSHSEGILKVNNVIGTFVSSLPIKGDTSHVSYTVTAFDEQTLPNEPISNNIEIKDEVDDALVWDSSNPFGTVIK